MSLGGPELEWAGSPVLGEQPLAAAEQDRLERLTTGPTTGQVCTARAPVPHAGRP